MRRDSKPGASATPPTSADLAAQAQLGDQGALAELFNRHRHEAYRVALRLAGNPFDAEEIVQASFERVLRGLGRYDPERPFRPWFMRVLVNQARTFLRRRRFTRLLFGGERETAAPRAREPDRQRQRQVTRELLAKAIQALPLSYREVFVLKHVEGYSYEEIAAVTGERVGNLKVRAHRARRALVRWLAEHGVTWGPDAT